MLIDRSSLFTSECTVLHYTANIAQNTKCYNKVGLSLKY